RDGPRLAVRLGRPRLTAEVPYAVGQLRVVRQVEALLLGGRDHAVVSGHGQRGPRREGRGDLGERGVDLLDAVGPLVGVGAVDVPGLVDLAEVDVDELPSRTAHQLPHRRDALRNGVRRAETRAPQRGPGEPGALED